MKLNPIFTSNMVFAANKPIRIYGEGEGDITVTFAGNEATAQAKDGKWLAELPILNYGGPYELTVVSGAESLTLTDIYVGEVYLLSGQSNLQFKLESSTTPKEDYKDNSLLRQFVTRRPEDGEYFFPEDGWKICTKEEAGCWTALGYHIGMELTAKKGVAVGLICCYQGASIIESWLPEGTMGELGISIPKEEKSFDHRCPDYIWNRDGMLYHHSLAQVLPFSLTGVVWYQGEGDAAKAEALVYDKELSALITQWRQAFSDEKLPFAVIQIANLDEFDDKEGWALIQQAQEKVQHLLPYVTTIPSYDLCETDDIHPPTKDKLAKRIVETLINW